MLAPGGTQEPGFMGVGLLYHHLCTPQFALIELWLMDSLCSGKAPFPHTAESVSFVQVKPLCGLCGAVPRHAAWW